MNHTTYTMVLKPSDLERAVGEMRDEAALAVDTESASFHRFVDRIYLVQVSTQSQTYLIDPIAVPDLAALGSILSDPGIEKIFHDADYDLRVLRRDFDFQVRHLFDTRVAAQLLGEPSVGLAALLEKHFNVHLTKKWQRADWSRRPLPDDMLRYAASDTQHLIALRDILAEQLDAYGRLAWAREEFELEENAMWPDQPAGTDYLRLKGANRLDGRQRAVLRALCEWRLSEARRLDRAEFRIVSNEILLDLARSQPQSVSDLKSISSLSPALRSRHSQALLQQVRHGIARPAEPPIAARRTPNHQRDPVYKARLERMRTIRNDMAERIGLEPGVLCAKQTLEAILQREPSTQEEMRRMPEVRRWQAEVLGEALLGVLASEA